MKLYAFMTGPELCGAEFTSNFPIWCRVAFGQKAPVATRP
jgi:hypothetical protein